MPILQEQACTFYTKQLLLPQTQSPDQLSQFLSSNHEEYDLDGWFFYGNLLEGKKGGEDAQIDPFVMVVQRLNISAFIKFPIRISLYTPVAVAFNSAKLNRYIYGGCVYALSPQIIATQDPWSITAICNDSQMRHPSILGMTLVKGRMGQRGSIYRLSSDLVDQEGHRLQVDIRLRDVLGTVNEGYGSASLLPQWIFPDQRRLIDGLWGHSVERYLAATGDPMSCQGSYYYSMPLMEVLSFEITRDGSIPLAKGTRGSMWMDYVVQSYNNEAVTIINNSSWQFFAIQLPDRKEALMVSQINTSQGTLPTARLFGLQSTEAHNGAKNALCSWNTDQIRIDPVPESIWISPSGERYYMSYRINLTSQWSTARLRLITIRNNQEFALPNNGKKYEGLARVEGTLDNERVRGIAWVELQPAGHL